MSNPVAVSFEFFPPSDEPMGQQLWEAVLRLAPLQPNFVSVTYGADGSTRTRTHECVLRDLRGGVAQSGFANRAGILAAGSAALGRVARRCAAGPCVARGTLSSARRRL